MVCICYKWVEGRIHMSEHPDEYIALKCKAPGAALLRSYNLPSARSARMHSEGYSSRCVCVSVCLS